MSGYCIQEVHRKDFEASDTVVADKMRVAYTDYLMDILDWLRVAHKGQRADRDLVVGSSSYMLQEQSAENSLHTLSDTHVVVDCSYVFSFFFGPGKRSH